MMLCSSERKTKDLDENIVKEKHKCTGILVNSWFQPLETKTVKQHRVKPSVRATNIVKKKKMEFSSFKIEEIGLNEKEAIVGKSYLNSFINCNIIKRDMHIKTDTPSTIKKQKPRMSARPKTSYRMKRESFQKKSFSDLALPNFGLSFCEKCSLQAKPKRIHSAPANVRYSLCTTIHKTQRGSDLPNEKNQPLYWRTRAEYRTKTYVFGSGSKTEKTKSQNLSMESHSRPGRPVKQNVGCPFTCTNCFRACLVSNNYMNTLRERKTPVAKDFKYRPKSYHQNIVQKALAQSQPIQKLIGEVADIKTTL